MPEPTMEREMSELRGDNIIAWARKTVENKPIGMLYTGRVELAEDILAAYELGRKSSSALIAAQEEKLRRLRVAACQAESRLTTIAAVHGIEAAETLRVLRAAINPPTPPEERDPGTEWKLSDAAKAEIEAIEAEGRRAMHALQSGELNSPPRLNPSSQETK